MPYQYAKTSWMSQFLGLDIQKEYEKNQALKWVALCQIEHSFFESIFIMFVLKRKKKPVFFFQYFRAQVVI